MTNTPYKLFNTDKKLEQDGIIINYGDFWIKIARAGGSNQKYTSAVNRKTKPYQQQFRNNTVDNKLAEKLLKEIYSETVILSWGSSKYGEGFLEDADGKQFEYSYENCLKLMTDLPDLFSDIQEQSQRSSLFKHEEQEADIVNL